MKRLTLIALVVCLAPAARAQDAENPYKKAKVGDWVEYKMTAMGQEVKTKMEVTAASDKEVTIKTTATVAGRELPGGEMKIDLTKPYDPTSPPNLPKDVEAKVEKGKEGKEKVKVGGKEYETTFQQLKVTAKVMGNEIASDMTVWRSKDVPLDGMVKMEGTTKVMGMEIKTLMELVGSGNKK